MLHNLMNRPLKYFVPFVSIISDTRRWPLHLSYVVRLSEQWQRSQQ